MAVVPLGYFFLSNDIYITTMPNLLFHMTYVYITLVLIPIPVFCFVSTSICIRDVLKNSPPESKCLDKLTWALYPFTMPFYEWKQNRVEVGKSCHHKYNITRPRHVSLSLPQSKNMGHAAAIVCIYHHYLFVF